MNDFLNSAFKELDILTEDTIELNDDGIKALDTVINDMKDIEDSVEIIDTDAKTNDELKKSYIGKIIMECPVCHSYIFGDKDNIVIDKVSEMANVDHECPHCCELGGFIVVGQVAELGDEQPDEEDIDDIDDVDDVETKEVIEKDDEKDDDDSEESHDDTDSDESEDDDEDEDADDDESEQNKIDEAIIINTNDEEVAEIEKDQTIVVYNSEDAEVETDAEVEVQEDTTDEVVEPVSEENIEQIESNTEETVTEADEEESNTVEVDFDEIQEESFENIANKYLNRVYENVDKFSMTNAISDNNSLILEGTILFKSGKSKNTKFVFEAKDINKNGNLRFVGYNQAISSVKNPFVMSGHIEEKKLITERLTYNYSIKDSDGKSNRVCGTSSIRK